MIWNRFHIAGRPDSSVLQHTCPVLTEEELIPENGASTDLAAVGSSGFAIIAGEIVVTVRIAYSTTTCLDAAHD